MASAYDTPPDGNPDFGPAAASSMLSADEQQARRSLRPPRLRRGLAFMWVVFGLQNVLLWLERYSLLDSQSHLRKACDLVLIVLLICALVMLVSAQTDAAWGVAVNRRGAAERAQIVVGVGLLMLVEVGALVNTSSGLRWCLSVAAVCLWTAIAELTRRRTEGPVVRQCAVLALGLTWSILVIWKVGLASLLFGGSFVALGVYEFAAVRRDLRPERASPTRT